MTCFYALKIQSYIILLMIILFTVTSNTLKGILKTLEQQSESAESWFKQNEMIVNADKFQAIILN